MEHRRYADGIDVLFATNTFHLSRLDLLQNIPRLILPQRLSSITSLEMLWNFNMETERRIDIDNSMQLLWDKPDTQGSLLHELCAIMPETFPAVRFLYISVQSWLAPSSINSLEDPISDLEQIFLGPVEQMLRAMGPRLGREFNVAIQQGAWRLLLRKHSHMHGSALAMSGQRFWKSLGVADGDEMGYWICSGWDDIGFIGCDYWMFNFWGRKWTVNGIGA